MNLMLLYRVNQILSEAASLETSIDNQIKLTKDAEHKIDALKQQIIA